MTTTIPDQQSCEYHQTAQLSDFKLATTADIIRRVLQSSAKSCTLDPIPSNLLNEDIDTIASVLTGVINTSLEYGVVPATMKHRSLKNAASDVNCLANYRPISNLSFPSKTLERYVAKELRNYFDTNGYNDPFQSAYRHKHSTETALVRIHGDLMHAVDSRHRVLLVLLDLSAAFDTLNHSPLYNISMLPIADIFDRHQIRYHIYAYDTQLYAECPPSNHTDAQRKIDECVNDIRRWLDDNHLFLNEANTEAILSRSSVVHSPSPLPPIYVCGSPI